MKGRYELSDQRWQMIEDIVSPPQTIGRPRRHGSGLMDGRFNLHQSNPIGQRCRQKGDR